MDDTVTFIVGAPVVALLGIALPALIWLLYRRVEVAMGLVVLVFLCEAWFHRFGGIPLGLYVYPQDFLFVGIGAAAFLRLLLADDFPSRNMLWLLFGLLLIVSLVIGYPRFGSVAGVEFREYFYFWTGTLYFMSFPADEMYLANFVKWWRVMAGTLVALAIFRWVADSFGWGVSELWRDNLVDNPMRVLNAGQTCVVAQALLMFGLFSVRNTQGTNVLWIGVVAAVVLALQHRTVWLMTACAMGVLVAFMPEVRKRVAGPLIAGTIVLAIAVGIGVAYGGMDSVLDSVYTSAISALDLSSGTQGDRIYGWSQLLGGLSSLEWVAGKPFGSGFARFESALRSAVIDYYPHNVYVAVILRTGLCGLFLFLAAYVLTMTGLLRVRDGDVLETSHAKLLFVLLFGHLVFYLPYQLQYEQCIVLGIGISLAAASSRDSARLRDSPTY